MDEIKIFDEKLLELQNASNSLKQTILKSHQFLPMGEIGELVRNKRKAQKLSQQELADLCGVGLGVIKRIESENHNITLCNLEKIFNALGIEICLR